MESVRPASRGDLATIVPLVDAFLHDQRAQRGGPIWVALTAATLTPEALSAAVDDDDQFVFVGCLDGHVVGVCIGAIQPLDDTQRVAAVRCLYVEPHGREVGVGSAMLDAVFAHAERSRCVGVDATVLPGNRGGKNFFEMHGMVARAINVHRPVGEGS